MEAQELQAVLDQLKQAATNESLDLLGALSGESAAQEFITTLKKICARKSTHPVTGGVYQQLQRELPRLSAALLDPTARAQLSDLLQVADRASHDLELQHLQAVLERQKRAGKCYDDDLRASLLKEYVHGPGCVLTEAEVDAAAAAAKLERQRSREPVNVELYALNDVRKLKNDLHLLESKVGGTLRTLYDFLGVTPLASDPEIQREIAQKKSFWETKPGDTFKTAAQSVNSLASTWLASPAARHKYDMTEAFQQLEEDGVWKHLAAYGADRVLEPGEMADLRAMGLEIVTSSSPEDIEDLIRYEADRRGISVTTPPPAVAMKRCGYCGRSSELSAKLCSNVGCGKSFDVRCVSCGTSYQSSAGLCPKCQTTLSDQVRMEEGVIQIEAALARRDVDAANDIGRSLEARYRDQKIVRDAVAKIRAVLSAQEKELAEVSKLVGERKLVAAAALLDRAAAAGSLSDAGKARLAAIKADVQRAEAMVLQASSASEAAMFSALEGAYAICIDSPRIHSAAMRFRPEPPKMLSADQSDGLISLKWVASPSVGLTGYRIRRKADSAPVDANDGEELGSTGANRFEDGGAPIGRRVYYSVIADRLGVLSNPLCSAPVVRTAPVREPHAVTSTDWVRVSWKLPPGASGAQVFRTEGEAGQKVPIAAEKDGFTDSSVVTGTSYVYSVQAEFSTPDGVRRSKAVALRVTPKAPPKPPTDATLAVDGRSVTVTFNAQGEATVVLLKSARHPALSVGQIVDLTDLEAMGDLIRSASLGSASDVISSGGIYYYTVVALEPPQAAIGQTLRVVALDDCAKLRAYPKELAIQAQWEWPAGAKVVALGVTRGQPPAAHDDPRATRYEVSRAEYERQGSFSFAVPSADDFHLAAFAGYAEGDEIAFASAADPTSRVVFHAGSRSSIAYTLSKSLFGKYQLKVTGPSGAQLPAIAIVAKPSFAPVNLGDGSVFFSLPSLALGSGMAAVDLPTPPKGHCLKVFFEDPLAYETIQINHPPADSLKVK